jgi:hypothetical protein
MAEQSHRDEMSAAIRAQRERHAVPRSIASEPPPHPRNEPDPGQEHGAGPERKSLLERFLRK